MENAAGYLSSGTSNAIDNCGAVFLPEPGVSETRRSGDRWRSAPPYLVENELFLIFL